MYMKEIYKATVLYYNRGLFKFASPFTKHTHTHTQTHTHFRDVAQLG